MAKLSKSKNSLGYLKLSKTLPQGTKEKLKIASERAQEKILLNDCIYQTSNAHASEYIVSKKVEKRRVRKIK